MCCLDKYILVTGSFSVELEKAYVRAERYNILRDKWEELAPLNQGRALHASCAFNQRHAFVFCGVEMPKGGLCNSIERLDMQDTASGWNSIQIPEARN